MRLRVELGRQEAFRPEGLEDPREQTENFARTAQEPVDPRLVQLGVEFRKQVCEALESALEELEDIRTALVKGPDERMSNERMTNLFRERATHASQRFGDEVRMLRIEIFVKEHPYESSHVFFRGRTPSFRCPEGNGDFFERELELDHGFGECPGCHVPEYCFDGGGCRVQVVLVYKEIQFSQIPSLLQR